MIERAIANRFAHQMGTDLHSAQQEIVLLYALDRLSTSPLRERLVFKGGTYLRKMILGDAGRLSEDLDFTAFGISPDPFRELESIFHDPHHAVSFVLQDPYSTEQRNWACTVAYAHSWDEGRFRIEISYREKPFLSPRLLPPILQIYFRDLPFKPRTILSLRLEEALAEKLRAVQQRATERDLYDVAQYARKGFNTELVRLLAVAKLWNDHEALDPERILTALRNGRRIWPDLERLVARRRHQDWNRLTLQAADRFEFLRALNSFEREVIEDSRRHRLAADLRERLSDY